MINISQFFDVLSALLLFFTEYKETAYNQQVFFFEVPTSNMLPNTDGNFGKHITEQDR